MFSGGSGDGREGGRPEREDDGGDDGGPKEGVRRAGGDRPAVDDHLQTKGISRKQAMIQDTTTMRTLLVLFGAAFL